MADQATDPSIAHKQPAAATVADSATPIVREDQTFALNSLLREDLREMREMMLLQQGRIALLREDLREMREMMLLQQGRMDRMERQQRDADITMARKSAPHSTTGSVPGPSRPPRRIPKAPQIQYFTGKPEDLTSTKVKKFIYSVRRMGALSEMSEHHMIALADCYLTGAAAKWMMTLEASGCKPSSIENLQSAMIAEFVPADEKIPAKSKMMQTKMDRGVDHYITSFRDLIEITGTHLAMTYAVFFVGLPDEYKEELAKKYPDSEPETMQEVYDSVRTIERALQLTKKRFVQDRKPLGISSKAYHSDGDTMMHSYNPAELSPSSLTTPNLPTTSPPLPAPLPSARAPTSRFSESNTWVTTLLKTKFYGPCPIHAHLPKNDQNFFCADHAEKICSYCRQEDHPNKNTDSPCTILHVYRYHNHDVLLAKEASSLLDISEVQTYLKKGKRLVYIDRRAQPKSKRALRAKTCIICSRTCQDRYRFCSIMCQLRYVNDLAALEAIPLPEASPLPHAAIKNDKSSGMTSNSMSISAAGKLECKRRRTHSATPSPPGTPVMSQIKLWK